MPSGRYGASGARGGGAFAALYEASRHLEPDGTMVVFTGSSGRSFESIRSAIPLPLARILTWVKPHTTCAAAGPFGWQSVLILMFGKCGGASRAQDNIRAEAMRHKRQGTTPHPAELPAEVCEWIATGIDIDPGHAALSADRLKALGAVRTEVSKKRQLPRTWRAGGAA